MLKTTLIALAKDQRGTSAIEMGLICALIILALMTALQNFAGESQVTWNSISSKSAEAIGGATGN
ncbi:MAG: Flp/Fap pilin component [Pseudomonadota bacterium]